MYAEKRRTRPAIVPITAMAPYKMMLTRTDIITIVYSNVRLGKLQERVCVQDAQTVVLAQRACTMILTTATWGSP